MRCSTLVAAGVLVVLTACVSSTEVRTTTPSPRLSTTEIARLGSAATVHVERSWKDSLFIATHPHPFESCSGVSGSGVHLGSGKVLTAAHVVFGQYEIECWPHESVVNGVLFVNVNPAWDPIYADAALTLDRLITLRVSDATGTMYNARVRALDYHLDLAVLDVPDLVHTAALPWGDSRALRIGDGVIAIGYPVTGATVTRGIVSALKTTEVLSAGTVDSVALIQTDAAVNPGNSGGPLLDENGEVVGIIDFRVEGGNYGLNFAVAATSAEPWARNPRRCSPGSERPNPIPPSASPLTITERLLYSATVRTCVR